MKKATGCNVGELVARLLELPAAIEAAEADVLTAEERRIQAEEALTRAEDGVLLTPDSLPGKNAEIRAAQLRAETKLEHDMVRACEHRVSEAKIALRRLTNELSALKTISRLLAGEPQ